MTVSTDTAANHGGEVASADAENAWFDEAVVIDDDWAVIYTKRDDGTRRGIRVPLRPVLAAEGDDAEEPTRAAS